MISSNVRHLQKTAEGDIAGSKQRLYRIRSKSLSGGSFFDGSVVLDHKKPRTDQRTIQYSLPPALEASVSSGNGDALTTEIVSSDKVPDDDVLQVSYEESNEKTIL